MAKHYYLYHRSIFKMDWYRWTITHKEYNMRPNKIKNILSNYLDKLLDKDCFLLIINDIIKNSISIKNLYYILKPFFLSNINS